MNPRSYDEALAALRRALVFGINPSLDGIRALVRELGDPHETFEIVQVAGTNGKGSTSRMIAAVLAAHGRRVGLYTSPELQRMNERISIGLEPLDDIAFARAVSAALDAAERLRPGTLGEEAGFTEFELLTAAALWAFREAGVDAAVLEVGMGGRWDATSVARPTVAVVTGVGLDHTAILGHTREQIAAEKAAIIREGSVAVLGPATSGVEQVILSAVSAASARAIAVRPVGDPSPVAQGSTVGFSVDAVAQSPGGTTVVTVRGVSGEYRGLRICAPAYQAPNLATAVAAAEAFLGAPLDDARLRDTLETLTLPGRFELLRQDPPVVIDGAHNPQAAQVVARAIARVWPDPDARPVAVVGVLADKDARGIVEALAPVVSGFVATAPRSSRALSTADLTRIIGEVTGTVPAHAQSVARAIGRALGDAPAGVVVTGSIVTAGEARTALLTDG